MFFLVLGMFLWALYLKESIQAYSFAHSFFPSLAKSTYGERMGVRNRELANCLPERIGKPCTAGSHQNLVNGFSFNNVFKFVFMTLPRPL